MEQHFDRFFAMAADVGQAAADAAGTLAAKGRNKVDRCALENKLKRAQRQLGAVVYTLRKEGKHNEALVNSCVEEIDRVKKQLAKCRREERDSITVKACPDCGHGVQEDAMFCGGCGAQLSKR